MKLAVFAFTRRGCGLAQGAKEILDAEEVRLVTMEKFGVPGFEAYQPPLNQCMEPYFRWADAILFIGSTGMAVRAIAPWVRDKKTDPAVLVMDEGGTFVISLLSGHIGGANAMTRRLVFTFNTMLGLSTPPFGMLLFITSSTSGTPLKDVIKEIMPMIVVMLLELILITFVPNVVLFLPKMFGMM